MRLSKEIKVALLAVVALVILFFGVRFLRGSELLSSSNVYHVVYDNIDGLTTSNPVIISGLKVGQVEKIRLMQEQNNHLLVTIRVDQSVRVGKSARAVLASSSILGGETIILDPGDVTQPLSAGDTLKGSKEQTIGQLVQAKALPIAEKFDSTLARFNQIIGVNGKDTMANILGMLVGDTATVSRTIDEIATVTQRASAMLRYNEQRLNTTIANLTLLTNSLSDQDQGLPPLLAKLNQTVDSLNNLQLSQTLAKLDRIARNLDEVTAKINEGEGTLGKFVNDDELYTNLNRSAQDLDKLLVDLRDRPGRYVRFSVFGRRDKDKDITDNEADEAVIIENNPEN
ncbi:MAG: MlaD family protein [Tunicatimonas sp.]